MLQSSVADEIRKLRKLQIFILRWRIFHLKFENQLVEITETFGDDECKQVKKNNEKSFQR